MQILHSKNNGTQKMQICQSRKGNSALKNANSAPQNGKFPECHGKLPWVKSGYSAQLRAAAFKLKFHTKFLDHGIAESWRDGEIVTY